MTLNLSAFQTVFDDNFANDKKLDTALWSDNWGYSTQYSFANGALTLTSLQSQYFYPVGFKQATPDKNAGEGYGLYQFSGYANAGQGKGISFIMWRAENAWLDTAHPGVASEIDVLESWNYTTTGESTLHWYDPTAKNNDGYNPVPIYVDLTKPHTYAVDWERGSLTFYVDGKELYQNTTRVPLDAADGGCNEVMGAQIIYAAASSTSTSVQLHITDMSYSAPVSAATPPPATIALSALGSMQETSLGAGVTVVEKITTTSLTGNVYAEVLTASGAVETGYQAVALSNGAASLSVHLAKTGDTVRVVNNTTNPTVIANSAAVTITDAATPSSVATVNVAKPAVLIAGLDSFNGIVTGGSPTSVKFAWHASATGETASASDMVTATKQSNGSYSATLMVDHPGQTGYFYVAVGNVVTDEWNAVPVSSAPAPASPTLSVSAPGSMQEASVGAGVTVTEKIAATNLSGNVYAEVLTSSGSVETGYQAVALNNGAASLSVHLAKTGDFVRVVDNTTAPKVTANSSAVTITDPAASGGIAAVSVAKPASLVAGQDSFTGIVTGGSPTSVKFAWHASATGETASTSDMVTATRQANGTYTATLTVDHPGQTGYFYVAVGGVVTDEWNAIPLAAGSTGTPTIKTALASVQGTQGGVAKDIAASASAAASGSGSSLPLPATTGGASALLPDPGQGAAQLIALDHSGSAYA